MGESLSAISLSNKDLPQVTTSSLQALSMYADARVLWAKGNYHEAERLYVSAVKEDADFAMAHAALGMAYYSSIFNDPVRGKKHSERAMQLSQRTTQREARMIQIDYEGNLGHVNTVRDLNEIFLKTYPDDYRRRYNFGTFLMNYGYPEEAVAQFLEVLRIAPDDANAYINLATSYKDLGKNKEALQAYDKAFKLEPTWMTSGNLNNEYGFTWVGVGDIAKAEEVFNKGLATSNKPLSTRSLALLDMYRGKFRSARERLQEAIVLSRANKSLLSESRNHLFDAIALKAQGNHNECLGALDKATKCMSGTAPQVWLAARIGIAYSRSGAIQKALHILDKAQKDAEVTNPQDRSEIHRLQGEIELARGNFTKAIEFVTLADREHHSQLTAESSAFVYRIANDRDKAIAAYETFIRMPNLGWELQQEWLDAHYWLASLYQQHGEKERAIALLEKLLMLWKEADPDVPILREAKTEYAKLK